MPNSIERIQRSRLHISFTLGALVFAAISVFFLWEEHRAHLLGALPYALLLLCPAVHLLMHHGDHGGHGHRNHDEGGAS